MSGSLLKLSNIIKYIYQVRTLELELLCYTLYEKVLSIFFKYIIHNHIIKYVCLFIQAMKYKLADLSTIPTLELSLQYVTKIALQFSFDLIVKIKIGHFITNYVIQIQGIFLKYYGCWNPSLT